MIIKTFTNTMVKKFIGKDLLHRLVIYPIKCPYYLGDPAHRLDWPGGPFQSTHQLSGHFEGLYAEV